MPSLIERLLRKKPKPVADERIKYRRQRFDYDCGQTCLDMLGWDGHQMFPGESGGCFIEGEAEKIFGTGSKVKSFSIDENTFFDEPYFLKVRSANEWSSANENGWHAVIAFKDQIYCPSLGIFKIADYKKNIWSGATGFQIPFAEESNLDLPRLTDCHSHAVLS